MFLRSLAIHCIRSMLPTLDSITIPTNEQVLETRHAIADLELQLTSALQALAAAEERVATIRQEIKARNEWIAPIRRVPADILALIFTIQSELDWKAPQIIAQVCRSWRSTLLATPRAWAFIQLPAASNDMFDDAISLWLARCSDVPLHVTLLPSMPHSVIRTIMKKSRSIECILLPPSLYHYLRQNKFPHLVQLCFTSAYGQDRLRIKKGSLIDLSAFPRLRSLYLSEGINDIFEIAPPTEDFPPLQELMVWSNKSTRSWIGVIEGAATSLKSLHLLVAEEDLGYISPVTIQLPQLRFLSFALSRAVISSPNDIPLKLITPNLECYEEQSEIPALTSLHDDTATIKELILNTAGTRNLDSMSNLSRLHLNFKSGGGLRTLAALATETNHCPKLEHLILYHANSSSSTFKSAIAQRVLANGNFIQVINSNISFLQFDPGKPFEYIDCGSKAGCCDIP